MTKVYEVGFYWGWYKARKIPTLLERCSKDEDDCCWSVMGDECCYTTNEIEEYIIIGPKIEPPKEQ